jgi:hypothetical protein
MLEIVQLPIDFIGDIGNAGHHSGFSTVSKRLSKLEGVITDSNEILE